MTSMIATCSVEKKNIDVSPLSLPPSSLSLSVSQETMSTCRFSQRVALIKNEVTVNEELDPKLVRVRQTLAGESVSGDLPTRWWCS